MRYTDLTNEELESLLEMAKLLEAGTITLFTFKLFMEGLNVRFGKRNGAIFSFGERNAK